MLTTCVLLKVVLGLTIPLLMIKRQMAYNMLSEINPTKYNSRVKVRAARIWQFSGTSKGKEFSSMELILVDEEVHQLTHLICF